MLKINDQVKELINQEEKLIQKELNEIEELNEYYSLKVLNAFHKYHISESDFNTTTGYGYNDQGRDKIEKVYADIFNAEDALVRTQFISGSHTLNVTLFALLRPGDTLLSITGLPYDTLHEVIGIKENPSSLKSFNINYQQIDLINNDFDYQQIKDTLLNNKIKVIEIQRSKGYSSRKSLTISKIEKVIKFIRDIDSEVIIMIDNCYCEFTSKVNPIEVGADICVGSLIKNLGGGIATNGGYVVGKHLLIELVAERLTLPGEGREVGPSIGFNRLFLQGIYMAPSVVASSLKTSILTSKVLEKLGYSVEPKYHEEHPDIVTSIIFNDKNKLIKYTAGIQGASAIDAHVSPVPAPMPGYDNDIIMASGSFTQGSSIEISCDGPLKEPYILYQQGGLTYQYGKIALMNAISYLIEDDSLSK